MGDQEPERAVVNPRQRRRKAQHELHAAKIVHARLLGFDVSYLTAKTQANIHKLQMLINKESLWRLGN